MALYFCCMTSSLLYKPVFTSYRLAWSTINRSVSTLHLIVRLIWFWARIKVRSPYSQWGPVVVSSLAFPRHCMGGCREESWTTAYSVRLGYCWIELISIGHYSDSTNTPFRCELRSYFHSQSVRQFGQLAATTLLCGLNAELYLIYFPEFFSE